MKKNNPQGAALGAEIAGRAAEIMKIAEQYGVEKNFLFITTFKRYLTQLTLVDSLADAVEKVAASGETVVSKEYVKGRKNLYVNPVLREYNNAALSANKTVSTLMQIIKTNSENYDDDDGEDPLLKVINGAGA